MHRDLEAAAPARRRSNGLRTRAEIIAAAERHFATFGFRDTCLGNIAAEVGIRRTSIAYHFSSKLELYTAVLETVFAGWTENLPVGGTAAERLEAAMTGWIDFVAQRPNAARLILREAVNAEPGTIAAFLRSKGGAPLEWFEALIAEGVAAGEFHPKIETQRFLSLMGAITVAHFAAIPWLSRRVPLDPLDREELEKHKHEILLVARTMLGYDGRHTPATSKEA
ncbi:MAG TPA: TetR/AcrR family transcriptional regulator [Candidatus Limnocylindria bacterium]|nr:TetR/AcrR family transcriptional regulator [Candidatus Limnocylindria bacterium]